MARLPILNESAIEANINLPQLSDINKNISELVKSVDNLVSSTDEKTKEESEQSKSLESISKSVSSNTGYGGARSFNSQSLMNLSASRILRDTAGDIRGRILNRFQNNSFVRFGMNMNNAINAFRGNPTSNAVNNRKELTQEKLEENREKENREKKNIELLTEINDNIKALLGIESNQNKEEKKSFLSKLQDFFGFKGLPNILKNLATKGLTIAGAVGSLGMGALIVGSIAKSIYDGFQGWAKSEEWGVSKTSGTIGGILGGTGSGLGNALINGLKGAGLALAFMKTGAMFGMSLGPVGILAGALLGGALGAVFGFIGGEKIAQTLDELGNWVVDTWKGLMEFLFGKSFDDIREKSNNTLNTMNPNDERRTTVETRLNELKQSEAKLSQLETDFEKSRQETGTYSKQTTELGRQLIEQKDIVKEERKKLDAYLKSIDDEVKFNTSQESETDPLQRKRNALSETDRLLTLEMKKIDETKIPEAELLEKLENEKSSITSVFKTMFSSYTEKEEKRIKELELEIENVQQVIDNREAELREQKKKLLLEQQKIENERSELTKEQIEKQRKKRYQKLMPGSVLHQPDVRHVLPTKEEIINALSNNGGKKQEESEEDINYQADYENLITSTKNLLTKEEGFKTDAYLEKDDQGNLLYDKDGNVRYAIGYGNSQIYDKELGKMRKVEVGDTIDKAEAGILKDAVLRDHYIELIKSPVGGTFLDIKDPARKISLLSTAYQLGIPKFVNFTDTWKKIAIANQTETKEAWNEVSKEILDSLWAKQTTDRANRVADVLREGKQVKFGDEIIYEMGETNSAATGMIVRKPKIISVGDYKGVANNPEVVIPMSDLEDRVLGVAQKINDINLINYSRNSDLMMTTYQNRMEKLVENSTKMEKRVNALESMSTGKSQSVQMPIVNNVVDNSNINNTNQSILLKRNVANYNNPFLMLS